jgi:hypothetical protein
MSLKEDFADHIKSQSEIWRAQIKDYQDQVNRAGEQAHADYKKAVALMETNAEEARKLFEKVQSAGEAAWRDMHDTTAKAFAELQKGWADALSRFMLTENDRRATSIGRDAPDWCVRQPLRG